jgi:hypothetical protein
MLELQRSAAEDIECFSFGRIPEAFQQECLGSDMELKVSQ